MKLIQVLFLSLWFLSCQKQENGQYKLEYLMDFDILAGSNPLLTHVYTSLVPSFWTGFLAPNMLDDGKISMVRIKSIKIEPLLSGPVSYGFFEEVRVFISNPADLGSKIQIGSAYPVPNESVGELFLLPGLTDVHPYVRLEAFELSINLRYRNIPQSNSDHRVTVEFDVFIK
ncbi:MAG: hypothetical protein IPP06_02035 [Saprospiraceae bacterium]|nr:hypothetical protein [Candidatus Vicinibacter affinis]MBP6173096.1 hypothetical protein [Saprospiraceae bacterium]MBK6573290.1 hypothetical protein [Candidatus Vicinibacter affinis]MBK6822237.1 hypothetical protein [Candidatus Vicinibacter affinis]MBK7301973.1 hypothetical protein [Candidatus Vicinibacter affinis]